MSLDRGQLGELAYPPLTGVVHDVVTWGRHAAEALLCLIDGQPPAPTSLPPSLLEVGRSAGPARR